jgi:hypothetical protein
MAAATMMTPTMASAYTRGSFTGMQFMINIAATNYDGSNDDSAMNLYQGMNVPVKGSFMGPGKTLEAPQKMMNFICADRTNGGYACTIILQAQGGAEVGMHSAHLVVTGDQAAAFWKQFNLTSGQFHFQNLEKTLVINSTSDRFEVFFNQDGI